MTNQSQQKGLVVFGGSFDPIHNGHLRIARAAGAFLHADVAFLPAKKARWKSHCALPSDRLAMLEAAIREDESENGGDVRFLIDRTEIDSPSEDPDYTVLTLRRIKESHPGVKLYLLLGADQVNKFPDWMEPEEISRLATPVYCPRPREEIDMDVASCYGFIPLGYGESGEVSSSKVRALQSLDIPDSVLRYIEDHRLYFVAEVAKRMGEHRLAHSISVANLSKRIALQNCLKSPEKAYIAGLLHDIAKEMGEAEAKKEMGRSHPEYLDMPEWTYHQFNAVSIAQSEFGVEDGEILQAIEFHASAAPNIGDIAKIVYSADKIEPGRGYDSAYMIERCLEDLNEGFKLVLRENMAYLGSKGYSIDNRLTRQAVVFYLGEAQKK